MELDENLKKELRMPSYVVKGESSEPGRPARYRARTRDRIVVGVANGILKLASRQYRDLLKGVIRHGLSGALRDAGYPLKPPFTEPLDDPPASPIEEDEDK